MQIRGEVSASRYCVRLQRIPLASLYISYVTALALKLRIARLEEATALAELISVHNCRTWYAAAFAFLLTSGTCVLFASLD
jgi:hypothetical protein